MSVSEQIQDLTSRSSNYVLLRRFSMPTVDGSRDAIAVTFLVSKILLAFYTLMIKFIIISLWQLCVLVAIAIATKGKKLTRNMGVAHVAIFNSRASPQAVIKAVFDYRAHIPGGYASMWAAAGFLAWAGALLMALLVSPQLIIGNAAPANLEQVYFPTTPQEQSSSPYLKWRALRVPANLRAIEVLDAVDTSTGKKTNTSSFGVIVEDPKISTTPKGNETHQVDYSYNISGVDFGLQHFPHLRFEVEGSCRTEYDWYTHSGEEHTYSYDAYVIYGENVSVSARLDGKAPTVDVYVPTGETDAFNSSFALVISSMKRFSFSPGTDPWYLTRANPEPNEFSGAGYIIKTQRPALSCWERSLWSNNGGSKKSTADIKELGLPSGLVDIFQASLSQPRIIALTQGLGPRALRSAATSMGRFMDAGSSSLHQDLKRLVLGAYVATKDTLAEMTRYTDKADIENLAQDPRTQQYKPGVDHFVIYGSNFVALSVRFLIIIPVITVCLLVAVYMHTDNPFITLPWAYVNALKAPVLYARVDVNRDEEEDEKNWNMSGQVPHYSVKTAETTVRPHLDRHRSTLSWISTGSETSNQEAGITPTGIDERIVPGTASEESGSQKKP